MQFRAVSGIKAVRKSDVAILPVFAGGKAGKATADIDLDCDGAITALLDAGDVRGNPGDTLLVPIKSSSGFSRALLVGCGPEDKFNRKAYTKALTGALSALRRTRHSSAVSFLTYDPLDDAGAYRCARALAEVAHGLSYRFSATLSKKPAAETLKMLGIAVAARADVKYARQGLKHGAGIGVGMAFSRELANTPANICTPKHLVKQVRALARKKPSLLKVKALQESDLKKLKMGSFLSVTAGTREPARFIEAKYNGGKRGDAPIVLVGKGITFDAGGISLKPPGGMDEMKFDMSGAASVLGTLAAVVELELPINLVVLVPSCENLPDGNATKPGDVVKSMSGQTIEILNTDAEGRLILCDALTYSRRFSPKAVIDVATLTGACVIALGKNRSGMMSHSDELAGQLEAAGIRADDKVWRLPLDEEYDQQLRSNFADMANVGGREAGTITAGCFLARFTKDLNWAHLDIAGTAYRGGAAKGSTGRPVPLLVEYLLGN